MTKWLSMLRRAAGKHDRAHAFRAEERAVSGAVDEPAVDGRLRGEMLALAHTPSTNLRLGRSADEPGLDIRLPVADLFGSHGLVLGATGAGKSRAVAGIIDDMLGRFVASPDAMGLWIVDHKSELVGLVQAQLLAHLARCPRHEAERLARRVVVLNPFATRALSPFQILRSEPGVAPELQAYDVTTLLNRLGGAELGVRQETFLFHLLLYGIVAGKNLPELARLVSRPDTLVVEASASPHRDVRAFFAGGTRIAAGSLDGVGARLDRLLRHPGTRLMLGAAGCLSFRQVLSGRLVLVDVGSPPLGCEDLGRFWASLVTAKLARAIFERSHADARVPVLVVVDEWQEGLVGMHDGAEQYERILSQARSRGVSFLLVSQSLATAARVSSSLPKVVATNTQLQMLFRASIEDARAMTHLLPVTGRKLRAPSLPWEERSRSPYLSPDEERESLVTGVSSLPSRTYYLWNRQRAYRAVRVVAREVPVPAPPFVPASLAALVREGTGAVPIRELERSPQAEPAPAVARPIADAETPPPRRPRRPRRGA